MKTELLSTVSHELRTPLGSIKGYATTLLTHGNKLRKEEQREFLEIIDSRGGSPARADREPARPVATRGRGAADRSRAGPTWRPSRTTSSRKVQLAAPQHELVLDWPNRIRSSLPTAGASPRWYRILLTNAVKYSPDGGSIALTARGERRDLVSP